MAVDEIFTCPDCDAGIEIADPGNVDIVTCNACSRDYRVTFDSREKAYLLIPIVEIEPRPGEPVEHRGDKPFEVLNEPGAPRRDDSEKL